MTLARFYVLSASANFIFSTTVTLFAITQGYSDMAIMFGVMAVLSIAEWCWAYGNYLLIDVYGNKGCATIECDPSGSDNVKTDYYITPTGDVIPANKSEFEYNLSTMNEVNGKYIGETSKGPVRVRIEGAHPLDENFNGDWDSDHFVDHIHIEHRKNITSGQWGKGWNNKITIPWSWIEGDN